MKKWEREAAAEHAARKMTVYLWLITVGLLVASVATGVDVFGGNR